MRLWLRNLLSALLVFSSLLPSAAWADGEDEEWVGKPAPTFQLADLEGNSLKLTDLTSQKVVWINFWGLRCGPCVQELPVLEKLYKTYKERGLVVIGLNSDGVDKEYIRKAMADRADLKAAGVTFPIAPDPEFKVVDSYQLQGAPLNVMIDKSGVVRYRHTGYEPGDETRYVEQLEKLLPR